MELERLVAASAEVAATSARRRKVELLAELLVSAEVGEVEVAVGFLCGEPRQGKVGVGWATVSGLAADPASSGELTLLEVDVAIEEVLRTTGPGSQGRRREILTALFERATPAEADFLRRLLTGEIRQGALAGLAADAIAKASGVPATLVRRAAMFSGDLGRVAEVALTVGRDGLAAIGMEVLRPVVPMLASTSESVEAALAEVGEASVEWKLDGIRVQVHRAGDDVRVFTRGLNDITASLPGIAEAVRRIEARALVLDGEAAWAGDPQAFQDLMSTIGGAQSDASEAGRERPADAVAAYFFDCLHVDGADLVDEPLRTRLSVLDGLVPALRIPGEVTADPEVARRVLDEALTAGHEGVVVKGITSAYVAGRRGKAWRKVKPHHTLDLVVLGAEWGHGRRRGWLSNLHLGARGSDGFVMVGKTFKGLTDQLLGWQTEQLLARQTHREGITVFVRPELVIEIALDGVQSSTRYPGGVALRFARVKRYRPDKRSEEADTIEAVRRMLR